jgi:hypothetical protein
MNKLANLYMALRHPVRMDGKSVSAAGDVAVISGAPVKRVDHGLTCLWRLDPMTGRLGCVWSSS